MPRYHGSGPLARTWASRMMTTLAPKASMPASPCIASVPSNWAGFQLTAASTESDACAQACAGPKCQSPSNAIRPPRAIPVPRSWK